MSSPRLKRTQSDPYEDLPIRLESDILNPTGAVPSKKFKPNKEEARIRPVLKRKSSELAKGGDNIVTSDPDAIVLREQKSPIISKVKERRPRPVVVAMGGRSRVNEQQKKEYEENSVFKQQEEGNTYVPISLPFFDIETQKKKDDDYEGIEEEKGSSTQKHPLVDENGELKNNELVFVQLPNALELKREGGIVGKLQIHKSGKMTIKIGDNVMQVLPGVPTGFYQEIVSESDSKLKFIGPVSSQVVIAPSLI